MINPRKSAVSILTKIEKDNAYSNITLSAMFKEYELSPKDKAFISALVYGVLDRRITLDYVLSKYMKTPIGKTAPFTVNVLRTALYQIMYMDKIPPSAAVNEAVKIIKKSKESRNSGFVNAVLRNALRDKLTLPSSDSAEDLSIRYSCPVWIVESFLDDYKTADTVGLLEESLKPPPLTLRVNTLKISAEALKERLENEGVKCDFGTVQNSLILEKGLDITGLDLFKKGYFHLQDGASQTAVSALCPKKGERVLDLCASPGGKSFTMAELMENEGEIISCDLYEQRVGLIKDGAERLGLDIIKPTLNDALCYNPKLGEFDCILCDVPCSGLGVLRRKPEIKYKQTEDFRELEDIQYGIAATALKYLKKGGRILYSTCTLRRAENEGLVFSLQKEYNNLRKVNERTLMPHKDSTDGFYYCLLNND